MCKFCEEENKNWNDVFEGVKHYNEFVPALEKDRTFYHNGTHIYITNNRAILDTTYFSYLINYCPMCRKEAGRMMEAINNLQAFKNDVIEFINKYNIKSIYIDIEE